MFDYSQMMTEHVGRFTVGFVGIGAKEAHSMGSGTLARYGKVGGIITCSHVIRELKDDVGLVCFPTRPDQTQKTRLDMSATDKLIVGTPTDTEFGPDLAFLRLPNSVLAGLESIASVIDGPSHREKALVGEPDDGKNRIELICGVIDEDTTHRIDGTASVTTFKGLLNVGRVVQKACSHGLDLLRFQPVPGPEVTPPQSYGGTSGGGLWRIYTETSDDGPPKLKQARMVGVAFWEKPVGSDMHIVCHGQQSVHQVLYEEIRKKWP